MKLRLELDHVKFVMFTLAAQEADERHAHQFSYQVSIPWGTAAVLCHEDERRDRRPFQRLVLSPDGLHQHKASGDGSRLLLVTIKQDFLLHVAENGMERRLSQLEFAPWGEDRTNRFQTLIEHLLQKAILSPLDLLERQEIELELTKELLSSQPGTHTRYWKPDTSLTDHPALNLALQLIQDELYGDLSLDVLSESTGISKFHLIRLFQKHIGQTPSLYIRERRLQRAEYLLRTTDRDVTDIAYDVGFGSLGAFERSFKKKYGVSPVLFRSYI